MNVLSARQSRLVGAAIATVAAAVLVAAVLGVIWLLSLILAQLSGVLLPLLAAGILALVMKPYYGWLHRTLRGRAVPASLLVLISLVIPFVVFSGIFGSLLVRELADLLRQIPEWIKNIRLAMSDSWPEIIVFWEKYGIEQHLRTALREQGKALTKGAGALGSGAFRAGTGIFRSVAATFSWVVFPVYFFFLNMAPTPQREQMEEQLAFLDARTRTNVIFLGQEFVHILISFFRGQLIIALLQGGLFALGFSLAGLSYGFALGLILGLLNIIPYLGNMLGLLICLPLAFFQPDGGWSTLAAVLVVIVIVQTTEGYFLTPKIMGDRTGLHPAVIIFALFFWGTIFNGIAGMILAIPLTAFLVVLWRLVRQQYLPREQPATQ
ncbi:MAG: AI-2E family transporter [Verrucomicrobiota bacterium]